MFGPILTLLVLCSLKIDAQSNDTLKYFFEGHTYQWNTPGNEVDRRLQSFDFSGYDGIWLGGDVCSEATLEYTTIEHIDGIFNLIHPNTHWTLGNHDARNGNWNWIEEKTHRKTYYTSYYEGISYMVLNTCLTPYNCEMLDEQYRIITELCDTVKHSSHLIFIMHHCLWENVPGLPKPYTYAQSNLRYFSFTCANSNATFLNDIYQRLIEVEKRGVEVILIMGDMGSKKIDIISEDGIQFLGTGLNRSKYEDPEVRENMPRDYFLEFKHVPQTGWLQWQFHDLDSLLTH